MIRSGSVDLTLDAVGDSWVVWIWSILSLGWLLADGGGVGIPGGVSGIGAGLVNTGGLVGVGAVVALGAWGHSLEPPVAVEAEDF